MPRRSKRREEDLIHAAIEALEDEVRCWREGPPMGYGPRDETVMLIRYPRMAGIGPADYDAAMSQTIEQIHLPKKEVPFFLRWRGMEAAIKVIRERDGKPEPAIEPRRDLGRIDETAEIMIA